jgi:hypothetical protein
MTLYTLHNKFMFLLFLQLNFNFGIEVGAYISTISGGDPGQKDGKALDYTSTSEGYSRAFSMHEA